MSVRLSLLALPMLLLLGACDGDPPRTAAGTADCCCNHCPATAAPAASAKGGGVTRAVAGDGEARTYRVRTPPVVTGGGYRYESTDTSGSGGRYGPRGGGAYGGVSVSVTESESSSSRYSYSESSSAYDSSSGGYAYGASGGGGYGYGPGGARVSSDPPHYPGYRAAQTDNEGYLTWPGKVED